MDGQDRGDIRAAPGEVSRDQGGLPVVGMDEVGCPILVQSAHGKFGRRRGKAAKTDIVVGPVPPVLIAVGVAGPVIKLRTKQDVNRQAVPGRRPSEPAGRHLRTRRTFSNDLNMRELFDDIGISRQQHPDIGPWP